MLTSGGTPVSYGASSIIDFTANNQLTLTKQAGRVIAGVSGSHLIGTSGGSDTYQLQNNDLPIHTHAAAESGQFIVGGVGAGNTLNVGAGSNAKLESSTGNNTTPNNAISLLQPTVYGNIYVKL